MRVAWLILPSGHGAFNRYNANLATVLLHFEPSESMELARKKVFLSNLFLQKNLHINKKNKGL